MSISLEGIADRCLDLQKSPAPLRTVPSLRDRHLRDRRGGKNHHSERRHHPFCSARDITNATTYPRVGCKNACGNRPTISKPQLCHSRTAFSFVATTKLN